MANNTNTQTTVVVTLPESTRTQGTNSFHYADTYELALSGEQMAIDELVAYFKAQASSSRIAANAAKNKLQKDIATARAQGRIGRSSKDPHVARMSVVANNFGAMLDNMMRAQKNLTYGEKGVVANQKVLANMVDHDALHEPYFGKFSAYDLQRVLMGRPNGQGTPRRGLSQQLLQGYATLAFTDEGLLLTMAEEAHKLNAEEAHKLIMNMDRATYQEAPYSQAGVFATSEEKANYDGITLVIHDIAFNDTLGEVLTFEHLRLSMEYKTYTLLTFSVVYGRYGEHYASKYSFLGDITEMAFGSNQKLPQNQLDADRLWDLRILLSKKTADDRFVPRPESEQKAFFNPGSFLSRRGFTKQAELLSATTYAQIVAKDQAAIAAKIEKRKQDAAQRRAAATAASESAVSNIPDGVEDNDALDELDEHPF